MTTWTPKRVHPEGGKKDRAARQKLANAYRATDVRVKKGRVEVRTACSTGWMWVDIGNVYAIRAHLGIKES